jgi:hypothetical protein
MNDVELHPVVAELSSAFIVKDGRLVMDPDDAHKHFKRLQTLDPGERPLIAEHLVALAFRFREQAADAAEGSIALLLAFTAAALDGAADQAASLFVAAGLEKETAALIGKAQTLAAPRAEPKSTASVKPKRGLR